MNFVDIDEDFWMIGIKRDRILYSGRSLPEHVYNAKISIELSTDYIIIPGFVDSHQHSELQIMSDLDVLKDKVESIDELKLKLKSIMNLYSKDEPIIVTRWVERRLGFLNRDDLDKITTERPIIILSNTWHKATVNSRVEKLLGAELEKFSRREYDKDLGVLLEDALDHVLPALLRRKYIIARERLIRNYTKLIEDYAKEGITCIHSLCVCGVEIDILKELSHKLSIDISTVH